MSHVTRQSEIPTAEYYVLCNDTFMSGWGDAQGKINTLIFPCVDYAQAVYVQDHAWFNRKDQTHVRIVGKVPQLRNANHYYQVKTIDDYPTWYGVRK